MQWIGYPLNALDSAIDKILTPQRSISVSSSSVEDENQEDHESSDFEREGEQYQQERTDPKHDDTLALSPSFVPRQGVKNDIVSETSSQSPPSSHLAESQPSHPPAPPSITHAHQSQFPEDLHGTPIQLDKTLAVPDRNGEEDATPCLVNATPPQMEESVTLPITSVQSVAKAREVYERNMAGGGNAASGLVHGKNKYEEGIEDSSSIISPLSTDPATTAPFTQSTASSQEIGVGDHNERLESTKSGDNNYDNNYDGRSVSTKDGVADIFAGESWQGHADSRDATHKSYDDDDGTDYDEDYDVHLPLHPWDDAPGQQLLLSRIASSERISAWHPSMNCRGVVQIRVLRAQHLPCPAGKMVKAVVGFPPWRGNVTTEWIKAYTGQNIGAKYLDNVCVRWDGIGARQSLGSGEEDTGAGFPEALQMVHRYNDESTPVPALSIELVCSSFFSREQSICRVVPLSVGVLMRSPGIYRRRWCPTISHTPDEVPVHSSSPRRALSGSKVGVGQTLGLVSQNDSRHYFDSYQSGCGEPLVLVEACFIPEALEFARLRGDTGRGAVHTESQIQCYGPGEARSQSVSEELEVPHKALPNKASFQMKNDFESDSMGLSSRPPTPRSVYTPAIRRGDATPDQKAVAPPAIAPSEKCFQFQGEERESSRDVDDAHSFVSASSSINPKGFSSSTAISTPQKRLRSRPHHFRVLSSWSGPTWCSVCSTMTVPFRDKSYQCESCNINCCSNCQLTVDVSLPCGSDDATKAAETAKRATITGALGEVMHVIAPIGEKPEQGLVGDSTDINGDGLIEEREEEWGSPRIGSLRIKILQACLYDRPYAPETDLNYILRKEGRALRVSNYYARITWTDSGSLSSRTRTVFQTATPNFNSEEMQFNVNNYGTEYRLEIVDADTDTAVGTCLLPAQTLLQWQRDDTSTSSGRSLASIFDIRKQTGMRKKTFMELRTGIKSGFGLDFFNASKRERSDSRKSDNPNGPRGGNSAGEISGWLQADVEFEEDVVGLISGARPRSIPSQRGEDFSMELVQLHIARISAIISDVKKVIHAYVYLISWENPLLTGASLVVFLFACLRSNAEYIGHIPILATLLYMSYSRAARRAGRYSSRWVVREREARIETEKKMSVAHCTHRPISILEVSIARGRNLRSNELGLPGAVYASVIYDPLRLATDYEKKKITELDPSVKTHHEIGSTVASGISASPEWTNIVDSLESERLKQLLPAEDIGSGGAKDGYDNSISHQAPSSEAVSPSFQFPILQSIAPGNGLSSGSRDDSQNGDVELVPWASSQGAVVVQICFQDVLNRVALLDPFFGEVSIPIRRLAKEKEIEGWFKVKDLGPAPASAAGESGDSNSHGSNTPIFSKEDSNPNEPAVYVKMKLTIPERGPVPDSGVSDAEKEASIIIAEEMQRTAAMSEGEGIGLIGTSLNTFNTVRGLGGQLQTVQNHVGNTLDMIERGRNLLNFSSPNRSSAIFLSLLPVWLIFAAVPTRALIVVAGIGQYAITFFAAYGSSLFDKKETRSRITSEKGAAKNNPTSVRLSNFFLSLPTDEDLRRTYFWEARREGERARKDLALKKRILRLNRLWKAQWFGCIELKEGAFTAQADRPWDWEPAFALVQGRRFIWWRNERHFDDGEPPLGHIFFVGHSGLGGLSPLEMRELSKEEAVLVVTMFGQGVEGQQKISLLCPTRKTKSALEDAVIHASMGAKNE